jgi:alpha-beta hydrolase superfamily lysophospholipase
LTRLDTTGANVRYAPAVSSVVSHTNAADGTTLLLRHWPAPAAEAGERERGEGDDRGTTTWASVLIVHGLGEHSGRYEHVGDQMAAAGLDVRAFDLRGQGRSGGRRGHVDRWSQFHDDLEERLLAVRAAAGDRPVVLYGHSLGGLVVLGYLLSARHKPDLVVVTSPGLDSTLAGWKKVLAPFLGRIVPTLAVPNGIDGTTLSRDPRVAEKVSEDPACAKASTASFGAEALAEQARVRREIARLRLPTLVLHGLDDGLVPPQASEPLGSLPNVERRTYPGLRHELHNEPEGPAILDEVIAWLRQRANLDPQPNTASGERLAR